MRASFERIARAGWPILAGVLLGLVAGAIWTVAQPSRYRAEARVLVRGTDATRLLPAVQALAEGGVLAQNVAQTLHVSARPRVRASAGTGGVVTLSVEASSPDRARQLDAEAAIVLTQLVQARFGAAQVQATVLDPGHPVEQTSPTPERNLLISGLIGLAAGAAVVALSRRREAGAGEPGIVDPRVERRLKARIEAVTKRERALARRAGELAERESRLEQAESAVATQRKGLALQDQERREHESTLEQREQELAATVAVVPPPAPQPAAEPDVAIISDPIPARPASISGSWTIVELEHLARDQRAAFPERAEEWDTYLFLLRDHANIDGSLPRSFDGLIAEVFGDALDR